jgi:hypothetical protein
MVKDDTPPEAKRTGREAPDPRNMPGEFQDDLRVNRFEPPPDPPSGEEDEAKE